MQKLLSSVLSLCLLVSSVSPSLAQVVPLRAVSRAVSAGTVRTVVPTTLKSTILSQIVKSEAISGTALQGIVPSALSFPQAQNLSASILQQNPADAVARLHNDWLGLAINFEDISRIHAPKATLLLTEDLAQKQLVFAQIPHKDLSAFLETVGQNTPAPAVAQVQDALADASAIALVGCAQDIPALLSFYKAAQGSIFEPIATVIAARGLLRYGAYEELNTFLQEAGDLGAFGEGLARYIQENNLPVNITHTTAALPQDTTGLARFLEREGTVHGLHANPSYEATRAWVELGKQVSHASPQEEILPATSARAEIGTLQIPAISLPTPITIVPQGVTGNGNALGQPAVGQVSAPQPAEIASGEAAAAVTQPVAATPSVSEDNSGVLYSGIPVFAIEKGIKKLFSSLRARREARAATKKANFEEADLHENTVHPVYEEPVPVAVNEAEDILSVASPESVAVEKDGYKLTVENENGIEHILRNVTLSVSPMLEQFSSQYNRLALTKDRIFELRNQVIDPIKPDHFFFALSPENGALETLIKGASALEMARPMRIKIQQTASPRELISMRLYADDTLTDFVMADVDKTLLPAFAGKDYLTGYLVQRADRVYYALPEKGKEVMLDKYFIRLPKEESKYWTKIFENNPQTPFALTVYSTQEKTFAWTYLVPTMQIGLGKTMAPELASRTQLGESASSMIMLGINNVLPVLMGFVHKSLKRYGEAAIGRIGVGSFVAGSAVALASGLYGALGDGLMSPWQTAGFVTSSVLIAVGTNITRFVQNILISANRGKIVAQDSFKDTPKKAVSGTPPTVYNAAYLAKRTKEVFTKSPDGSARDVVLFQTASMFKNLGTMLFLSFPWLANGAVKLATGMDLNLDFSASYVPYSLFSAWTLYKVCKTAYKDAFPNRLNLLDSNLQETKQQAFKEILGLEQEALTADNPVIIKAAKQLKSAIDAIAPVEARETEQKAADVIANQKLNVYAQLMLQAGQQNKGAAFAQNAADALKEALENLGRREVKVLDVMKMNGIPASLAAMTLATFHELAVSNGFAFGMHEIVGRGATANALTALALYGSMSAGRILGNMLSRRVSGGTMYAVSSSMSVAGTALMAAANGNIGALISGAVIASFGVGNFFSQMYEYMTGLYPKYRREIALLINYTMPAAAILTFPMRWLVGYTGVSNLDLIISGAGLLASLALTPGMFANSSIIKAAQYGLSNMKTTVRNIVTRHKPAKDTSDIDDALPE